MKKLFGILLLVFLLVLPLQIFAELTPVDINNYNVPDYLKVYVNTISYSNIPYTFERDGIEYTALAVSMPDGNIIIYRDKVSDDVILHEIGHIVYWSIPGNNPYTSSEELANTFVIKSKQTNTLKELFVSMGYWKFIFDEIEQQMN